VQRIAAVLILTLVAISLLVEGFLLIVRKRSWP
jgi:hypothetical protein